MISIESKAGLAENLEQTYFAIAGGIPGTETVEGRGWKAVVNPFRHPICNFGICADTDELDSDGLLKVAVDRPFFNIYVSRHDAEGRADRKLLKSGFSKLASLSEMATTRAPRGKPTELREAITPLDRKRVSDYMIWQFFFAQGSEVREKIAFATMQSQKLQLYELVAPELRERPAAAVMLHRTQGVLGLYNLCVGTPFRSRGIGTSIVYAIQRLSCQESVILGLQCDSALAAWYRSLGMEHVGDVDIYGLSKRLAV